MVATIAFSFCFFYFTVISAYEDIDKVAYGTDNRKDVYELDPTNPMRILTQQSIAALITRGSLGSPNATGYYNTFNRGVYSDSSRLGVRQGLCSNQKFLLDPTAAFCSGTLIAPDRIITAGHCVSTTTCSTTSFLFNYYVTGRDSSGYPIFPAITNNDLYHCRAVYSMLSGNQDYAVIHLDRIVDSTRHTPATISTAVQAVALQTSLVLIGFPTGIPAKIAAEALVTNTGESNSLAYFQATVDAFAGNSGSGVFLSSSLVQVGILVRGNTDYVLSGSCSIVNIISGCTSNCGEEISYAFHGPADTSNCLSASDCNDGYTCYRTCLSSSNACTGWCTAPPTPTPSPIPITCGQTVTGSTASNPNVFGNAAGDAIYSLTLTSAQSVVVDACASQYDTWLHVLNRAWSELSGCDDCCSSGALQSRLQLTLAAGTYVIVLDGYAASTGAYSMTVLCGSQTMPSPSLTPAASPSAAPSISPAIVPQMGSRSPSPSHAVQPSNDGRLQCGQTVSGTTIGATNTFGEMSGDRIFWFSAASTQTVTFDACSSSFDTVLHVLNSNQAEIVSCDDCCGGGLQSSITVTLDPGSYLIVLEGYLANSGSYVLNVDCNIPSPSPSISRSSSPSRSRASPSPSMTRINPACVPTSNVGTIPSVPFTLHNFAQITSTINSLQSAWPSLVKVSEIGRSVQNRQLWMVEVTGNVGVETAKPEVLLLHNMHGDENLGMEISLHWLAYLTSNYDCNPTVKFLLDNTRLFVMPSMNPDGHEIPQRTNANGVDLNRDFPDFNDSPADVEAGRQPETIAVMRFIKANRIVHGFNTHGGDLVCNYPFDSGVSGTGGVYMASPDDAMYVHLCSLYSNLHPTMHLSTTFPGGITNGYEWYNVFGGLQDYIYRYYGAMHVTLELGATKYAQASTLTSEYSSNFDAVNGFVAQVHSGVRGVVKTPCGGSMVPVNAQISVTDLAATATKVHVLDSAKPFGGIPDISIEAVQPKIDEMKIVGGTQAPAGEYPFAVSLRYNGGHFCGASYVAPDLIMTAGHCTVYPATQVLAVIGHYTNNDGEAIFGREWVVHPNFNPNTLENDIAFLRLSSPAQSTNFVSLVFDSGLLGAYSAGVEAKVIGWGVTSMGGTGPSTLREVNLPIVSDATCASSYPNEFYANLMTCAGVPAGGVDSCQGDSGGPLLSASNPSIQIGIVSWGDGCALPGRYGVYTRLASFAEFVRSITSNVVMPSPLPGALMPVRTDPDNGDYYKMLLPGTYVVTVSADDCTAQSMVVTVPEFQPLTLPTRFDFNLECTRCGAPSASPTPSTTPSPSISVSSSRSPSRTPTASRSASRTPSRTKTITPSRTPSKSVTPTPSRTKSPSASITVSKSSTPTRSPSRSITQTRTRSPSRSLSRSRSPSPSPK